jgi:hypothetical protein
LGGAHRFEWHGGNALGKGIATITRIDHGDLIELQIVQRGSHRSGEARRIHALALDAELVTVLEQDQIQFCAVVRRPKIRFVRRGRGADLGMRL